MFCYIPQHFLSNCTVIWIIANLHFKFYTIIPIIKSEFYEVNLMYMPFLLWKYLDNQNCLVCINDLAVFISVFISWSHTEHSHGFYYSNYWWACDICKLYFIISNFPLLNNFCKVEWLYLKVLKTQSLFYIYRHILLCVFVCRSIWISNFFY